jgi:fructokinase
VKIVSMGEILWDVIGEAEHLGGAPFNFSAHAARLGHTVRFISAVGEDARGARALERLAQLGLSPRYVLRNAELPTGVVTVQLEPSGQPSFLIHRPAAYDAPGLLPADLDALAAERPDWVYFGTLLQMSPRARLLTEQLLEALPKAKRFYDVNLRRNQFEPARVRELLARASVVKLNEQEAVTVAEIGECPSASLEEFCRAGARHFGWEAVCVTRGERGCALMVGGQYVESKGYRVRVADAVGAGDAFAAAFLDGLGRGWDPKAIADFANRVGALIASRPGGTPDWTVEEARQLAR